MKLYCVRQYALSISTLTNPNHKCPQKYTVILSIASGIFNTLLLLSLLKMLARSAESTNNFNC